MDAANTVNRFHETQGKHGRQLSALARKPISKWKPEDFAALKATRDARDVAVAALTRVQYLQHVLGYSREDAESRVAGESVTRAEARREEQAA
jgi:hypothetical protein